MIRGWRLYLSARNTTAWLALTTAATVLVLLAGVTVFELRVDPAKTPRFTPVWEAVPVLLAVLTPALLRPGLASWEMPGRARIRARAASIAAVGALLPATLPWIAHWRLPPDARWWDISCNVAFFAAVSLLATTFLGRLAGPIIGLCSYAAAIVVQQSAPQLAAHLPVSGASTNLTAHPVASIAIVAAASAAWYGTMGQSRFARNLHRNN
ncbi:hypothetical protein BA895_14300 [Humibacillus sp. DSM 29435]|nr:hypothetical protein BA895_14300 [Humibacillus sp. DSM 29435]